MVGRPGAGASRSDVEAGPVVGNGAGDEPVDVSDLEAHALSVRVALDVDERLVDRPEDERLDDVGVAREVEVEIEPEARVVGRVVSEVGDGGGEAFRVERLRGEGGGE